MLSFLLERDVNGNQYGAAMDASVVSLKYKISTDFVTLGWENDLVCIITRPDTRQDSRGQLGRGRNAKTARNSKIFVTDRPTRQGVESHVRD